MTRWLLACAISSAFVIGCAFDGTTAEPLDDGNDDNGDGGDGDDPTELNCTPRFADDFGDSSRDAYWSAILNDGIVTETENLVEVDGTLEVDPPEPGDGSPFERFTGYRSVSLESMADSALRVEFPDSLLDYQGSAAIIMGSSLWEWTLIAVESNQVRTDLQDSQRNDDSARTYDPATHRILQMRERGGTLFYEASADGTAWIELSRTETPSFIDGVLIEIGALVLSEDVGPLRFERVEILSCE